LPFSVYRFIDRNIAANSVSKITSIIKVGGMMGFFAATCKTIL
jgi:hypothetical protein